MAVDELDPKILGYRLGRVERTAENTARVFDDWRREVDKDRERLDNKITTAKQDFTTRADDLASDMAELSKDLKAVKTMLVRFSFSIAGAAITFAITILAATGRI